MQRSIALLTAAAAGDVVPGIEPPKLPQSGGERAGGSRGAAGIPDEDEGAGTEQSLGFAGLGLVSANDNEVGFRLDHGAGGGEPDPAGAADDDTDFISQRPGGHGPKVETPAGKVQPR